MTKNSLFRSLSFLFLVSAVAALAFLTREDSPDCANVQRDMGAAVLAENPGDQDALTNRAMLMQEACSRSAASPDSTGDKPIDKLSLSTAIADGERPPNTVVTETPIEILEHRCVVCHGCYDAPCQLKLEAQVGLERGASKDLVYEASRLRAANLTRLFDDALDEQGWRDKGFYPVVDKKSPEKGVMYRMLQLKQAHPIPTEGPLPESFDFSLYRDQTCPSQDEFDQYASDNPLWGMPYGFPGLNHDQHQTLSEWLLAGAAEPPIAPLSAEEHQQVERWESYLNQDDLRHQLVGRYIYEHLFLASLFLVEGDNINWFRLVRSRTAPGKPLELIATRRPYDDPGVERVYYRLQRMPVTLLAKTHMPYRMDQARLERFRQLFTEPDYEVRKLPGYAPEVASNPFRAFRRLPINSRYRFLLEESRFTIMNYIKGPVCRGQVALNVIDDHFWVMFANPDEVDVDLDAEFLAEESDNMRLPHPATGTVVDIVRWRSYAKANARYQQARAKLIGELLDEGQRLTLDSIWDGDGDNNNASLTVFRHFDTASVVPGLVGNVPKTAWVIDYPLLERIHYLLVAGFDVYGSAAHQLESRLYMDFLRMEGEINFLLFMPADKRLALHDNWYRDARRGYRDHFLELNEIAAETTNIEYRTENPKHELLLTMRERLYGAKAENFDYDRPGASTRVVTAFKSLEDNYGAHNSLMPSVAFVNLIGEQRDEFYTLVQNSAHSNIAEPFGEAQRRLPEEDGLTVVRGFIGAYPNYFFQVGENEIEAFTTAIAALNKPADYLRLKERYGVRRNAPWFWRVADKVHARSQWLTPIEYGIFDFSRYEEN